LPPPGSINRYSPEGPEGLGDFVEYWSDKLLEWSLDLYKDHRMLRDFEQLRSEIESEMPPVGGVALDLAIGMRPSDNNKYLPEYLGLQILGPVVSKEDAEAKYKAKPATANETVVGMACRINDSYSGPTIGPDRSKASTPGLQAGLVRYAEINPKNVDDSGGLGILMRPYVKHEIVFVGRNFLKGKLYGP
jgi:hypothetical protein